jgi:uncharacterized MAPEG superfamily protein
MTIPEWILLGFAGWTLITLLVGVGVYRWSRILTGRAEMKDFRADGAGWTDFYTRATRAHANCVENLPVYAAMVFAARAAGLDDGTLDLLACTILGARVLQTLVHLSSVQTNKLVGVRFALFFVQLVGMLWMGVHVAGAAAYGAEIGV